MKLAAVAVGLGGLSAVSEVATAIAAVAAALAGIAWIYGRILRPIAGAALRTYKAVESLEELPGFMHETRDRLEQGSKNFRSLEERLSLAERAAFSVAQDAGVAAEYTQALVRDLGVPTRSSPRDDSSGLSDT